MRTSIAVIGLGPMGSAIATKLTDGGHTVTVWNRSPARAEALADRVSIAPTPQAAVDSADITVVCLLDNTVASEVLADVELSASGVVVNLSSDTPAAAARVADRFSNDPSRFLSGVMLTPSTAVGQEYSTMMVAGSAEAFSAAETVLASLAPSLTYTGSDAAVPAAYDLALLDAFWTTFTGWTHALALGRAHGLRVDDLTPRLDAMVRLAADVGAGISASVQSGDHTGDVSTAASALATVRHIVDASEVSGISSAPAAAILQILEDVDARGLGASAPSSMVIAIEG